MKTEVDTSWMLPWHFQTHEEGRRARFKVIIAHRKAKKTLQNIKELDRWAQAVPAIYWIVFPTLAQGKKVVWDDPDMFARNMLPVAWKNRNATDHFLAYPNGSKVYLIGAKGEDALRGPNPMGVIFDEYDDMGMNVWPTVQPIMTANPDAWAWFTGTYKGKKDLYAKHQYALAHPGTWWTIVLKASESGIIAKEDLEEARATTTAAFFDMEYECIPIEGGTSFFTRIKENLWDGNLGQLTGREFQLGIDLAKYNDWTVITPVDLSERKEWGTNDPFLVGTPDRFNQIDWPFQKVKIQAAWGLYNKARINIDKTGLGDVVTDDLIAAKVKPLEGLTFTEQQRNDLLKHTQILLATDRVRLPAYDFLIEEMQSVSYDVGKNGRIHIGVPDGMHDDCVMSLCLALWGAKKRKPVASRGMAAPRFVSAKPTSDNPLGLNNEGYSVAAPEDITDQLWRGNK